MSKIYKRNKRLNGVGINDATYVTQKRELQPDGSRKITWLCPFYNKWAGMIRRCYSGKLHIKYPSYKDHEVCEEWLTFSNFKAWMETQDWEGKDLDKDLLVDGNKVYSPASCLFIDQSVNRFMVMRGNDRGDYPVGVSIAKCGLYSMRCSQGDTRSKAVYFKTYQEAHKSWQVAKKDRAIHLQSQQTDSRVIDGLQRIIDKLNNHIENNIETKSL